jgi:hypothetical protein
VAVEDDAASRLRPLHAQVLEIPDRGVQVRGDVGIVRMEPEEETTVVGRRESTDTDSDDVWTICIE